ncbi:MAG: hypothetical protein KTR32_13905 [Granulosicoccus sp.]|nr:hypothetical protein [Granulosicoccus sp.]
MKMYIVNAALAIVLFTSAIALGEMAANRTQVPLKELEAHTFELSGQTAVVYFVELDEGNYQVVTTVGPNVGTVGKISQHKVSLSDNESWSLDVRSGESTQTIKYEMTEQGMTVYSL